MEGAWIEAFKVGHWTDSAGNSSDWTAERIDALLAKYNPHFHMAPLRVDHAEPQQRTGRGPAFGWISGAKREGERVMVQLSQVQPQFEQWVKSGLVKFRSIAWDPARGIHHLAFLGYNCPAVPGMENVYSDGNDLTTIQFEQENSMTKPVEKNGKSLFQKFFEFMTGTKERSKFCADCTDHVCVTSCPTGAVSLHQDKGAIIDPAKCTICYACSRACGMMRGPVEGMEVADYSQKEKDEMKIEDVEAIVTKSVTAVTKQFSDQLTEFGEKNKALATEVAGLRKQLGDSEIATDRRQFEAFCQTLPTRVAPSAIPAIVDHMLTLKGAAPVEFDDGKGGKTQKSQLEMYQESLKALPETIQLSEFATGNRAAGEGKGKVGSGEYSGAVDQERLKLHNQVLAYQDSHTGTSYETALNAVMNDKGGK